MSGSCVLDTHRHGQGCFLVGGNDDTEVGHLEGGVGESVAEGEEGGPGDGVVVSIAYVNVFPV